MFLKLMTEQGRAFDLVSNVRRCTFRETHAGSFADVRFADGTIETFDVPEVAFVLNEAGVTIERFGTLKQQEKQP